MENYDVKRTEEKIREFWEKEKIYKFDLGKKGKVYSVDTPPPTVSGDMHIGHAFSYSQQDFIARFRRMYLAEKGQVFYPFGTDDNGLPTERLVERLNNVKSKEMPRSEFIDLCIKTLKKITPDFVHQWKNMGISADYDLYYSTIDKISQRISQESFLDLYRAGRIYKLGFPSIWCPECQTAIAQAELEDKEFSSFFLTIKFSVGKEILPISTTRPELIPACVAIFVNPKDERYKKIVGKKAKVPLYGFEVPVIEDKSADMKKGTGAMMICSYGDKFDVDAIKRLKLEPKIVFNYDGIMKEERYSGLKIEEAREKIFRDLKERELIIDKKNIIHIVNVHDKCGTKIEFLPTDQWFIKILDKKKEFLQYGKKIKWYPEYMQKRYENWINGLEWDWIISRDRHFGVPIPVWQCIECNSVILPDKKDLPIDPMNIKKTCPKCKKQAEPETMVLDTWATSSLTPQIASSLVKNKIKIPYSFRPQGHDIIRTWAFYTIVKAFYHEKNIPWEDIIVSGFVKLRGEKMSKSKGIIIDPKKIIGEYGADAIRFWAAGSKLGEDLEYKEEDVLTGKKLITKLLNASNFVFMNLKDYKPKKPEEMESIDKLFLDKVSHVVNEVGKHFMNYEYSKAKSEVENLFWNIFCDNYLEIVKKRVYNGSIKGKLSAQYTLYKGLLNIIKMLAPIMPFITEYIYQKYFRRTEKTKSIHISEWPSVSVWELDGAKWDTLYWDTFIDIVSKVRQEKTKAKKSMNSEIILYIPDDVTPFLNLEDLKNVTNAKEIKEGKQFKVDFI